MIREATSLDMGTLSSPANERFATPVLSATAPFSEPEVETAEHEIARLTWSVLGGSASLFDRQRLAELVNAQHARRHG